MANVKFNDSTFYVPSHKFLVAVVKDTDVFKNATATTKKGSLSHGQVFAVSNETNDMYQTKVGYVKKEDCEVLLTPKNEIKALDESFVVKVISNLFVYTEPDTTSHASTVLRIGSLPRVIGQSEDFYQLEHGGFIEKRGCRRH